MFSLFDLLAQPVEAAPAIVVTPEVVVAEETPEQKVKRIEYELGFYCGTIDYHQWSALFRNIFLTDGAMYLAEECGAFWLMDLIASYQGEPKFRHESFQVWKLVKNGTRATAICDNGNGRILATQEIGLTDFPLSEIKLYCADSECGDKSCRVIMLTGEY